MLLDFQQQQKHILWVVFRVESQPWPSLVRLSALQRLIWRQHITSTVEMFSEVFLCESSV